MRSRSKLATVIAVTTTLGVTGLVARVEADPDESQRLRGLGDRVFLVDVDTFVFGEVVDEFVNCYFFESERDANGKTIWFEAGEM